MEDAHGDGGGLVALAALALVLATVAGGATLYAVEEGWIDGLRATNDPTDLDQSAVERAVHRRVNAERAERGLDRLAFDTDLRAIARRHSRDMIERGFFAHTNPDGEQPIDRYRAYGYDCERGRATVASENLGTVRWDRARLNASDVADRVVTSWLESPDHRKNMLNEEWRREGIGMWANGTTVMVTQNFC